MAKSFCYRVLQAALLLGLISACGTNPSDHAGTQDAGSPDAPRVCGTEVDCHQDEKCHNGVCRPKDHCEADADCESDQLCNLLTSRCVQAQCQQDPDCGKGLFCQDGRCTSLCAEVACPEGQTCDLQTGDCERQACTIGAMACEIDADCAEAQYCDPLAHGCTQCPSGFFCNIHECFELAQACKTHSDCPSPKRCSPDSSRCEDYPDSCIGDRDCEPMFCNIFSHTCQADPFTGECVEDAQCQQAFDPTYYCHIRLHNCVLALQPGGCYDTTDCADPQLVCDLKNNACVPRGKVCGVDTDCELDYGCINGICVFQCNHACISDNECAQDQVCRNECCMDDKSCSNDWQCTPPDACINNWCSPPPACASDDILEDNDDPAAASVLLLPPAGEQLVKPDLFLCSRDSDWYRFQVPAAQRLTASIAFLHASGDLDLKLYTNPADKAVDTSASDDDSEEVSDTPLLDSTYFLEVFGHAGASTNYQLTVERQDNASVSCEPDDDWEENDAWSSATPLAFPAEPQAVIEEQARICSQDEDWWSVNVPAGFGFVARILFEHDDGDLDINLFDEALEELDSSHGAADTESVGVHRSNTNGVYFVQVKGFNEAANDYMVQVENTGGVDVDCTDGSREPNDEPESASALSVSPEDTLFICLTDPADQDWYRLEVPAGCRLDVNLAYDTQDGTLDARLFDETGTEEMASAASTTSGTPTIHGPRVVVDTVYLLRLTGTDQKTAMPYELTLEVADFLDCTDDGLEPNDTATMASAIDNGFHDGLLLCCTDPIDQDWYRIFAGPSERPVVSIAFDGDQTNLNLALYDASGNVQLDSSSDYYASQEEVSGPRRAVATDYLVKVNASAWKTIPDTPYQMTVTMLPAPDCSDGGLEPNDTAGQAVTLLPGEHTNLAICEGLPADTDWYAAQLKPGERIRARVASDPDEGDLDLFLFAPDTVTVLQSDTYYNPGQAQVQGPRVTTAGAYFLQVVPKSSTADRGVAYTLSLTVDPAIACDDDVLEPNNKPGDASTLAAPGSGELVLCPGDVDVFAFETSQPWLLDLLLVNVSGRGDVDLRLTDFENTPLAAATMTGTAAESLVYSAYSPQTFLVHVMQHDELSDLAVRYRLDLALKTIQICDGDLFEPNDNQDQATLLNDQEFVSASDGYTLELNDLRICNPGPVDWYAIDMSAGTAFSCLAKFSHSSGDIDLYLYDPDGDEIDSSTSSTDNELVTFTEDEYAPQSGRYTIKVRLFNSSSASDYGLVFNTDTAVD